MAGKQETFRVPVVVWVDTPGVDFRDAQNGAELVLGTHFEGPGREALRLHFRSGVREMRVVAIESVWEAMTSGHLLMRPGPGWAERAGEKTDD